MTTRTSRLVPLAGALLLTAPAFAAQYGPLEISGFMKDEYSWCDNCSRGLVNPSPFDPRGALTPASPNPPLNQGGPSYSTSANLGLAMLTLGLTHEFSNAFKIEAKASGRVRNNAADIYNQYLIDGHIGIEHPVYGTLQIGVLPSRSWSRADAFAYRLGLSTSWAESGAGYGVFKQAVRYTSPEIDFALGKLTLEATYATAKRNYPLNYSSLLATVTPANYQYFYGPPKPQLLELFAQYSNQKNLIELIYQQSEGGYQSSFTKGAFTGAIGSPNTSATAAPGYQPPRESLVLLEGDYWFRPQWRITYGLKRNEWSGQQQQCDFGNAVTPAGVNFSGCFWDQAGFNYASDNLRHHAVEYDALAGLAYTRDLWTFTIGGVRMNKAYVKTPTEWGQSNTATFVNLGVYRKMPEVLRGFEVYGGIARVMFGRQGPAPLSMPNNTADFGVDPRTSRSGNSLTIGANLNF
ncbi:MAG: hypothetical protein KGL34_03165 [Gammaproteobacteria bacterium]|nr:hypothetical protein [Gammaproteobacteria bacterium]